MFERFTAQAREVVVQAQREARTWRHPWMGTEHLLLALLAKPEAPGVSTLNRLGITTESGREAVAAVLGPGADGLVDADLEALRTLGIDPDMVRQRAEERFGEGALDVAIDEPRPSRRFRFWGRRARRRGPGHLRIASRLARALERALREALARKDPVIGPEHLLLGLLATEDRVTKALFDRLGVEPDVIRTAVLTDLDQAA